MLFSCGSRNCAVCGGSGDGKGGSNCMPIATGHLNKASGKDEVITGAENVGFASGGIASNGKVAGRM